MKKRLVSLFLALAMTLSLTIIPSFAEEVTPDLVISAVSYTTEYDEESEEYSFKEGDVRTELNAGDAFALKISFANTRSANAVYLRASKMNFTFDNSAFSVYEDENVGSLVSGNSALTVVGNDNNGVYDIEVASTNGMKCTAGYSKTVCYVLLQAQEGAEVGSYDFDLDAQYINVSDSSGAATTRDLDTPIFGSLAIDFLYREDQSPNVTLSVMKYAEDGAGVITEGKEIATACQGDAIMVRALFTNDTTEPIEMSGYSLKLGYDVNAFEADRVASPSGYPSGWYWEQDTSGAGVATLVATGSSTKTIPVGGTAVLGYLLLTVKEDADFTDYDFHFIVDGKGELNRNFVLLPSAGYIPGINFGVNNKVTVEVVDYVAGDVNASGIINAADALLTLQHSVEIRTLEGTSYLAADVDKDGSITVKDVLLILQYSSGKISSFD